MSTPPEQSHNNTSAIRALGIQRKPRPALFPGGQSIDLSVGLISQPSAKDIVTSERIKGALAMLGEAKDHGDSFCGLRDQGVRGPKIRCE